MKPHRPLSFTLLSVLAACATPPGDSGAQDAGEASSVGESTGGGSTAAPDPTEGDSTTGGSLTGGDGLTSGTDSSTGDSSGGESSGESSSGESSSGESSSGESSGGTTGDVAPATAVDVLFIIDNSGSMADTQKRIAEGIDAFVDPLLQAELDLRIAVTTTDHGNPRCVSNTPENGALVVESCRVRVADGEYMNFDGDLSSACLDVCDHETITTLPTATADDPNLAPRPWIEWNAGVTNVEVPLSEAMSCAIPQGITGCGFEQPLEALHSAIQRMHDAADPAAGFLRPEAHFVVIIVTDETDCSFNVAAGEIFTVNKSFWNSPDDVAPTSAMCWNAGIACQGGPGTYDDCVAADYDLSGAVTMDPDQAVLHPVSRYDDALAAVAADKLAAGSDARVQLVVIGGVPLDWPEDPLVFADSSDPDYQALFGIGAGCSTGNKVAVPPGRMREVAALHAPLVQPMFSICQPDLSVPLGTIGEGVAAQ